MNTGVATETRLEAVREEARGSAPGEKGLKSGAISFVSNVVIGTASVAPAYSRPRRSASSSRSRVWVCRRRRCC